MGANGCRSTVTRSLHVFPINMLKNEPHPLSRLFLIRLEQTVLQQCGEQLNVELDTDSIFKQDNGNGLHPCLFVCHYYKLRKAFK